MTKSKVSKVKPKIHSWGHCVVAHLGRNKQGTSQGQPSSGVRYIILSYLNMNNGFINDYFTTFKEYIHGINKLNSIGKLWNNYNNKFILIISCKSCVYRDFLFVISQIYKLWYINIWLNTLLYCIICNCIVIYQWYSMEYAISILYILNVVKFFFIY